MVRLADGDRTAFDLLLDELWPVMLSFAARAVGHGPDAEDIAQEVFFKICSRIADFDRRRDALSWAFGIARYEIMTHRRRLQRRREIHDDTSLTAQVDGAASQEEMVLEREVEAAFAQLVGNLDDEDRRLLGLDAPRAPDALGATVRKRRQRALDRLRGLWRQIYGES